MRDIDERYRSEARILREDRLTYSEPLVVENLLDGDPMIYVGREHSLYKVFRRLANGIPEWCLHLQIQLNRNYSSRTGEISRRGGREDGFARGVYENSSSASFHPDSRR